MSEHSKRTGTRTEAPLEKTNIFRRLYYGDTDFTFVPRYKRWFGISIAFILIGLVALGVRGLNLGIDFTGGNQWEVAANGTTVTEAEDAIEALGFGEVRVQEVGDDLRIRTAAIDGTDEERVERNAEVVNALTDLTGVDADDMIITEVGPSWGREISSKALRALVVFLVLILIYITIRFEFRMALATIAALLHDLLVVVGAYAIFQLPVTPATVVAVLTILGFSIYDGVVVFDRVDENTRLVTGAGRMTYSDMVDLSLNQVLMRSLNTQITSVIPIIAVLIVGSLALGAQTLQEFGFALFIGQVSGAYSSIFIASPILALLKEREPRYKAVRAKLEGRAARSGAVDAEATAGDDIDDGADAADATDTPKPASTKASTTTRERAGTASAPASASSARSHPPRPRKQGKKR